GKFGAGLTVGGRASRAGGSPQGDVQDQNPRHRRNAGLAAAEALAEEGPQSDRRRVHRVGLFAEGQAFLSGEAFDEGLGKGLAESLVGVLSEGAEDRGKGRSVRCLVEWHGTPLTFQSATSSTGKGSPRTGTTGGKGGPVTSGQQTRRPWPAGPGGRAKRPGCAFPCAEVPFTPDPFSLPPL